MNHQERLPARQVLSSAYLEKAFLKEPESENSGFIDVEEYVWRGIL